MMLMRLDAGWLVGYRPHGGAPVDFQTRDIYDFEWWVDNSDDGRAACSSLTNNRTVGLDSRSLYVINLMMIDKFYLILNYEGIVI